MAFNNNKSIIIYLLDSIHLGEGGEDLFRKACLVCRDGRTLHGKEKCKEQQGTMCLPDLSHRAGRPLGICIRSRTFVKLTEQILLGKNL